MLIDAGLKPGQAPEEFNVLNPEAVYAAQKGYADAGADIILTNTFGGSGIKLGELGLRGRMAEFNRQAVIIARKAAGNSAFVAGSIGPSGRYLPPIGSMEFDEAATNFREETQILADSGVDLIVVETMSDIREMRACLVGIREVYDGPVIAHMTFSDGFTTITGTDGQTAAAIMEALDVDAIGVNCSTGPKEMMNVVEALVKATHLPISVEPNAGMPVVKNGKTYYPEGPEVLGEYAVKFANMGINILGACCGSNPHHIRAIKNAVSGMKPVKRDVRRLSRLCSRDKTIVIDDSLPTVILGERINPTGRKKFAQAIAEGDFAAVRLEADKQVKSGAKVLDVNMGVPGIDEVEAMRKAVKVVQSTAAVPLCLDSPNAEALEAGLKEIEGKPLINSVTAEDEKLDKILPLVKKYGAAVIGLPLNEKGIPATAEERFALGKKILDRAIALGIAKEDVYLDGLTMTVSTDGNAPGVTLETIRRFRRELGVKTILGVSNVSFGLPEREEVNSAFLTMAISAGLSLPIINPYSDEIKNAIYSADLLTGRDKSAKEFLKYARSKVKAETSGVEKTAHLSPEAALGQAIIDGDRDTAVKYTGILLKNNEPGIINDNILIPAMLEVGRRYDKREYFLPQVIMSAEAMHGAFAVLKPHLHKDAGSSKGKIILATVKGDVHDIGKNIVAAIVENHGYEVIDLGKNVGTPEVVDAVKKSGAEMVGLSALMTTTMGVMREMVSEIKAEIPVKIIVGGAVVTRKFAEEIGADGYAKDAGEAAGEIAGILNAKY